MFKMLIVEDERWEREGLVDFLDWGSYNIEVSGTACDGIDGLEQALRIRPDIIITDIKMPGMDGIAMSKRIKELLPETKIIILTGYDDFNYAKEAISFNVNGYILKILEEEEMIEVIKKVVKECEREKERKEHEKSMNSRLMENLRAAKTAFFNDLLEERIESESLQKKFIDFGIDAHINDEFMVAVVKMQDNESGRLAAEPIFKDEKASGMHGLLEEVQDIAGDAAAFSVLYTGMGEIVFCFNKPQENETLLTSKAAEIAGMLKRKYTTDAVIGLGEPVSGIRNIRQSFVQARQAVEFAAFWRVYGAVRHKWTENLHREFSCNASEFLIQGSYFTKQIVHALRSMDEDRIFILVEEMFAHIRSHMGASRDFITNYLQNAVNEISILVYHLNKEFEQPNVNDLLTLGESAYLPSLQSMQEKFAEFVRKAVEGLGQKRLNKDEQVIKKVIKLIEERYAAEINLKIIAGEVFLTPNYLGAIFKKSTGKSITDFISEYRMEKAKELLKSPKNKVNWVAAKVGIPNTSYFCTIFKNTYGVAPGEYQEANFLGNSRE